MIFLGQLSQVTFDSVLLDRILITLVDPQIIRVALEKCNQRGQGPIEIGGSGHGRGDFFELSGDHGEGPQGRAGPTPRREKAITHSPS